MALRPIMQSTNKKHVINDFQQTNAKRQKCSDDSASTSGCENNPSVPRGDRLINFREPSRPVDGMGFNEDMDDSFFMTQAAEIQRIEDEATQGVKVRETHNVAPSFASRPQVQPKHTPLRNEQQNGEEQYLLVDDKVVENLARVRSELEKCTIEKTRLEEDLRTKDGEIKNIRAKKLELEKEKMQFQRTLMTAELDHRSKLDSLTREHNQAMDKVNGELQFLKKDKSELEQRLVNEKKRRDYLENQLATSNHAGAADQNAATGTPFKNRNSRNHVPTGPAFPDRRSFYSVMPTQPIFQNVALGENDAAQQIMDFENAHDIQERNHAGIVTSEAETKKKLELVNQSVQTESPPIGAKAVKALVVAAKVRLTSRLREKKPGPTQRAHTAKEEEAKRFEEGSLGCMLQKMVTVSIVIS